MPFGSKRAWTVILASPNLSDITAKVNVLHMSDVGGKVGWNIFDDYRMKSANIDLYRLNALLAEFSCVVSC